MRECGVEDEGAGFKFPKRGTFKMVQEKDLEFFDWKKIGTNWHRGYIDKQTR